ncbi:MAG: hypothetical protein PF572_03630 [Patescibacteria group bacterium]|jgi:CxxC-x17-CxxC domain-containing protein|nr:hypothetical protein [Patescibacteria group bacterium]
MGKFKKDGGFGGFKRHGGDRDFKRGGGSDRPVTMHKATCSDCGVSCEVPFRPTGDKPVFCSDCFANKDTSNKSRNERRANNRTFSEDREMHRAVCSECGVNCEVPFRPTGDKPVFCSDCFGKGVKSEKNDRAISNSNVVSSANYKKDFEMLNIKLDSILQILSARVSVEEPAKELKAKLEIRNEELIEKKEVKKPRKPVAPKKVVKKAAKKVVKKKVVKKVAAKKKK